MRFTDGLLATCFETWRGTVHIHMNSVMYTVMGTEHWKTRIDLIRKTSNLNKGGRVRLNLLYGGHLKLLLRCDNCMILPMEGV